MRIDAFYFFFIGLPNFLFFLAIAAWIICLHDRKHARFAGSEESRRERQHKYVVARSFAIVLTVIAGIVLTGLLFFLIFFYHPGPPEAPVSSKAALFFG